MPRQTKTRRSTPPADRAEHPPPNPSPRRTSPDFFGPGSEDSAARWTGHLPCRHSSPTGAIGCCRQSLASVGFQPISRWFCLAATTEQMYSLAMSATMAATPLSLADEIAVLAAQVDVGTHRLLTCIRRFDESEEWGHQGARTCADWLAWRIGLAPGAAREKVRVARALGKFPAMDAVMAAGGLSYAKVRALTRVATATNEAQLVEIALVATGAQ